MYTSAEKPLTLKLVIKMWEKAFWLGLPTSEIQEKKIYHGDLANRFAYFRCELRLPARCSLTADITANSRYRLWVNGDPVLSGPCKGDRFRQYYETVDLTPYLREGNNSFCAQVLYCDADAVERQTDEGASIYGVIGRQCGHRLAVEGEILDASGASAGTITTGAADWRVWLDNSFRLSSTEITRFLGAVTEEIDFSCSPVHWKEEHFDSSHWRPARVFSAVAPNDPLLIAGVQPMFRLRKREIPLLYEKERRFPRAFGRDGESVELLDQGGVRVGAGKTAVLFLDAGVIVNGYPQYRFRGGKGAQIQITYFENSAAPAPI